MGGESTVRFGAMGLGFASIIAMPIIYGIMGFIGGLIGGVLYNLIDKIIGGIKIELVQEDPTPPETA